MILEKIKKPNDIHKVSLEDFPRLAVHNVLDLPQDKLIWDVGHQAYTHKILTGRKDGFKDLRKEGG